MKFNNLIKATPFLTTLILLVVLNISNNKENTKLRILIWDTPSLSLGTYLAISTGTGFMFSYLITTKLAKSYQKSLKSSLEFRDKNNYEESHEYEDTNTNISYENTLIERDIKDPSPTINANFRIIGRRERSNINFVNNDKYDNSSGFAENKDKQTESNENIDQVNLNSSDWNDESYSKW